MQFIIVGIGSFIGGCLRHFLNLYFKNFNAVFPFSTLLVNTLSGLLIGFVIGVSQETDLISQRTRLFLTTGIFGGLSTFSTFSLETIELFNSGKYALSFINMISNLSFSFLGVVLGLILGKFLFNRG